MPATGDQSDGPDKSEKRLVTRKQLMAACAAATDEEFTQAIERLNGAVNCEGAVDVRPPEIGMIMMRGRIGGDGSPFNLGEATVTRAVVRLETGEIGYSYMLGRSKQKARIAAMLDAIGQSSTERMMQLEESFVAPVTKRVQAAQQSRRTETQATRVNFFTMVRGDD